MPCEAPVTMTVFLLAILRPSEFGVFSQGQDPAIETQTSLVSTAILPCVAREYGHTWCVASTRRPATSGSTPGRLILTLTTTSEPSPFQPSATSHRPPR